MNVLQIKRHSTAHISPIMVVRLPFALFVAPIKAQIQQLPLPAPRHILGMTSSGALAQRSMHASSASTQLSSHIP